MASGLLTITSVTNEGGGVYLLGVADSSGVAPNDHLGARRTNATGPGAVYLVTQVPSSTSVRVTDTLTQENGGTFGVPIAGAAWFGTPSAAGLSLIPHTAAPYDAAARRNAYLVGAAGLLAVPVPVASGGTAATTAEDARTSLGIGSMATQAASAVAITGGSISGITDLAVADGGTGASNAAGARTNLELGTIATQAASNVAITGGSISGITDLAVSDGGTGASDASGARTNLGLVIGTNVQAQDSSLQQIADATFARGAMIFEGAGGLTNLAAGAQNTLLAMGAQDPAWSTLTALLDAVLGSTAGSMIRRGAAGWEIMTPGSTNNLIRYDGSVPAWSSLSTLLDNVISSTPGKILQRGAAAWEAADLPSETVEPSLANGRLSVSSSDPIGEGTSATLYYVPYVGNAVALYNGSAWVRRTFTSAGSNFNVAALSADTVYDVFAYDSGGTVTLEAVAWSDSGAGTSTRATALVYQDGVLVKSGDATRRYLGTIRTVDDGGTKARDTVAARFVSNEDNRVPRDMAATDATASWTYTTATWRQANAAAANQLAFVLGTSRMVRARSTAHAMSSTSGASPPVIFGVGVGLDRTNGNDATVTTPGANGFGTADVHATPSAEYIDAPSIGYHYAAWVEQSTAAGATTWYGTSGITKSGITGEVWQ